MKVRIDRNTIHHFIEQVLDAQGQPTGETKGVLQFDIIVVEYPKLPTYGIRVDYPISRAKVKAELMALKERIVAQMQRDAEIRDTFEQLGYVGEFDFDEA